MSLKIHFVSFSSYSSMRDLLHHFTYAADSLARTAHLDKVKATAVEEAFAIIQKVSMLYGFLQLYSSNALVSRSALICAFDSFRFDQTFNLKKKFKFFHTGEFGVHFGWPRSKQWNSKPSQLNKKEPKTSKCEFSTRQQQSDICKQCQRNLLNMRHITDILFYFFYF